VDQASDVYETEVSIEFSEAMDQNSVESALALGSNFAWSNGGTTVTFDHAYPFQSTDTAHTITVPTSVTDVAGNALEQAYEIDVTMAALVTVTLEVDLNLTGHVADGSDSNFSFFRCGDNASDVRVYGGITFPIDSLTAFSNVLALESATYKSQVLSKEGDPEAPAVGGFVVDHVEFASRATIDTATVLSDDFGTLFQSGANTGDPVSLDITVPFETSWSSAATQFQLRFEPVNVSADATADLIYMRRSADENNGIVGSGVQDPDATNRGRVEVMYFE